MGKNIEKNFKKKYQITKEQLKELQAANSELMEQMEQRESQLLKYRSLDKEFNKYRKENEELIENVF